MEKISAKWGFGNAPLKTSHREKTSAAIQVVLDLLGEMPAIVSLDQLEAISHVKGQFTRTVKQDQWDWSTVWILLGRPSRGPASAISKKLGALRVALKEGNWEEAARLRDEIRSTEIARYLDCFLAGGREKPRQDGDWGFLYILSTRSQPKFLKIGITQRTVEVRTKEINSATGVIVPYGIRAVWRVDDAASCEREVHTLLDAYRIRQDREFFEIDFLTASQIINDHLGAKRMFKARDRERASAGISQSEGAPKARE